MGSTHKEEVGVLEEILDGRKEPRKLSLSVLKHITNDFSHERIIGYGGCGEVYKGILQNGSVAVKKIFSNLNVEDKEFDREIQSMMQVKHPNVVRFIGYCSNTEHELMRKEGKYIKVEVRERLLCFEHISNGSLRSHITDGLRGLEWHARYKIIKGICEGLHHLHMEKNIIHMDLKPANILVHDQMVPKIADFGLSRLAEVSRTMSNERLLSLGYCAPEYQYHGKMSLKSDIYSLGVIMLELVTGSKEEPDITNEVTYLEDMLGIEPLDLHFLVEPTKQISCSVHLTNATNDCFAFIVQTTNPKQYCIQPDRGVVPPRSECSVAIVLSQEPTHNKRCSMEDELSVQSTRVDEGVTAADVSEALFTGKEDRTVDHVSLMVGFDMSPSPPEEQTEDFTFAPLASLYDEEPQLSAAKVSVWTSNQLGRSGRFSKKKLVSILKSWRARLKVSSHKKLETPKHDCEIPEAVEHEEVAAPRCPKGPLPQRDLSPLGEACSRMNMTAIHEILVNRHYRDDDLDPNVPSLEEWTQQSRDMLDDRKRGDFTFRDKDFRAAIDWYTKCMDVGPKKASPTVLVRRSCCHLMCGNLDAALRDAMQAQRQYPDCPTSLYMQAVALSKLGMHSQAMGMLIEASEMEANQKKTRKAA
ncbi:Vesicle-associated protein 1-1 [Zea mays]|uniref:Vesicle-associated protein 1-1 n=1 Tax=Zea mays TaxID=4577 RepID=K7TQC3_MAIZE|nr:Vesicle-associated protein 1-1 [Zea mays]AQK48258.1 Vesicle-associated protein 1-1 [Zea mays]AQK48261.1 Vesicle-associated protein 1-1 [Zea mays]AQK48262.1 Vesicle-associated protein 1-1 [Zea mays]